MKKTILSFLFLLSVALSFGQTGTFKYYRVQNAGGTFTISPTEMPNTIFVYGSGAVTLSNDFVLDASSFPSVGTRWKVYVQVNTVDKNGHDIILFGHTLADAEYLAYGYYEFTIVKDHTGVSAAYYNQSPYSLNAADLVNGAVIIDGSLPLDKLETAIPQSALDTTERGRIWYGTASNVTSTLYAAGNGKILVGDGTDVNSVAVSGDVTLNSAGVVAIAAGAIVNADINASAAIALSKLAALTASKVVVTDGSGIITTANQLTPLLGGNGIDNSAATGFPTWSAGTQSVGVLTDVRDLHVSFVTSSQGTYYITFPVAVTVTAIEARVETALAATDSATITCQNNSGTAMTGNNLNTGMLVLAASATTGTGYTSTLTANNTFAAGERMRLITNKGTQGGTANVQVTYTRTN